VEMTCACDEREVRVSEHMPGDVVIVETDEGREITSPEFTGSVPWTREELVERVEQARRALTADSLVTYLSSDDIRDLFCLIRREAVLRAHDETQRAP